jgi:hypothetical protein|tara:strand:- start:1370 stop:1927 length:558 start_codon:yes stop_codon:yes gene_type:complete
MRRSRSLGVFRNKLGNPSRLVESIQRGTITLAGVDDATATITAVDPNRSVVMNLGNDSVAANSGQRPERAFTNVTLTDATTVTAAREATSGTVVLSYVVIQYEVGTISVQRGELIVNGATSNTATINSVDVARSYIVPGGIRGNTSSALWDRTQLYLVLTNLTTVTATKNTATDEAKAVYQVVSW